MTWIMFDGTGYETAPLMIGLASGSSVGKPVEWECGIALTTSK